jgi:hypothetical protein
MSTTPETHAWHALRTSGIDDRRDGFTRLLAAH